MMTYRELLAEAKDDQNTPTDFLQRCLWNELTGIIVDGIKAGGIDIDGDEVMLEVVGDMAFDIITKTLAVQGADIPSTAEMFAEMHFALAMRELRTIMEVTTVAESRMWHAMKDKIIDLLK